MAFTTHPGGKQTREKFIVYQEEAGKERMIAKQLGIQELMLLHGPRAKDYADLSHLAKGITLSRLGQSLSKMRAPFTEMLEGTGAVEVIDKNYVQWKIYGEPDLRCMSFGDANDPNIEHLGLNHSALHVWADTDFYKSGDVLAPLSNKQAGVVITSEFATPYDGGYLYDVVIQDDNPAMEYDRAYLTAGEYFLKIGSVQSWESIGQFGSIQMAESYGFIEYRVPLSTMGWEFTVEGEAHRQFDSIIIARCDEHNRPFADGVAITNFLEEKIKMQIAFEKEMSLMYGRHSSHLIDPKTGKQITTSPGFYQWLDYGTNIPYNHKVNSLDFFGNMFQSLWFDRLPVSEWSVTLLTGIGGYRLFSDWVQEKFGSSATITNYDFILKERTPYDSAGGRDGYAYAPPQFTEYVLPGFGVIKIAMWEALNDTRINPVKMPGSEFPLTSFEFIALDSGFGEPNVKQVVRNDNMYKGYAVGYWSPFGATNMDNPYFKSPDISLGDSYKMLHSESFGLIVTDPELLVRFRPTISSK